jgi:hypothetical protein
MEDFREIILENEELREQLEVQKREYLRMVETSRDNSNIIRPNKEDGE